MSCYKVVEPTEQFELSGIVNYVRIGTVSIFALKLYVRKGKVEFKVGSISVPKLNMYLVQICNDGNFVSFILTNQLVSTEGFSLINNVRDSSSREVNSH